MYNNLKEKISTFSNNILEKNKELDFFIEENKIKNIYDNLIKSLNNDKNSIEIVMNILYLVEIEAEIYNEKTRLNKKHQFLETNYEIYFWEKANWIIKILFNSDIFDMDFESENWYWDPNNYKAYELYIGIDKKFSEQKELIEAIITIL